MYFRIWDFSLGGSMKTKGVLCPKCGTPVVQYLNPVPTVDIIIEIENEVGKKGIVLIRRKNEPPGWAIPGGFVDYGAAAREAKEETGLEIQGLRQFHVYSDPRRDPRRHTISTVFIAQGTGLPKAGDDAVRAEIFSEGHLPDPMAFDHADILKDYFGEKRRRREIE
ncbi:MAG: mUTT [Deltaproteobacteria bacterium]|nr:mUTT [Deltaproteobacteria bacterium]